MEKTFKDIFLSLLPLSKSHALELQSLGDILSKDQLKDISYLLKTKKIMVARKSLGISSELANVSTVIMFTALVQDTGVRSIIKDFNELIREKTFEKSFKLFSSQAREKIKEYIGPNILGMEYIKEAAMLQLFSKERFHLLLVGDPGTGKTDILRSTAALAPISSFGLGSGTSGAGLSVMMKGKILEKGLLPQAHEGLCCIDELNLMKPRDMAALYSAMEKGFITYDKGGTSKKIKAEVRVQATANPNGDRFVGKSLDVLKQQLPFDSALLTRFHVVFVIRKPDPRELMKIAQKIVRQNTVRLREEDIAFIKSYVTYAQTMDVDFDAKLENHVTNFILDAKERENRCLVEIGPRTVHGIMRLSQAYARINLRSKVVKEDVENAIVLFNESLKIDDIVRN